MDMSRSIPSGRTVAGSDSRSASCRTRTLTSTSLQFVRSDMPLAGTSRHPTHQVLAGQLPLLPCSGRRGGRHPGLPMCPVAPARVPPSPYDLDQTPVLGPAPGVQNHAVLAEELTAHVVPPNLAKRPHGRGVPPALRQEVTAESQAMGSVTEFEPGKLAFTPQHAARPHETSDVLRRLEGVDVVVILDPALRQPESLGEFDAVLRNVPRYRLVRQLAQSACPDNPHVERRPPADRGIGP